VLGVPRRTSVYFFIYVYRDSDGGLLELVNLFPHGVTLKTPEGYPMDQKRSLRATGNDINVMLENFAPPEGSCCKVMGKTSTIGD
jgi:hypothetical protein